MELLQYFFVCNDIVFSVKFALDINKQKAHIGLNCDVCIDFIIDVFNVKGLNQR